ncbi:hypothetical protein [Yinghuangia sp. YIM S10712]|uniref:hypothetical protein n=1 Tax=Yinghuangia sp. YIM S10712 TaxID=3436930 RepID=UPI003F52D135
MAYATGDDGSEANTGSANRFGRSVSPTAVLRSAVLRSAVLRSTRPGSNRFTASTVRAAA